MSIINFFKKLFKGNKSTTIEQMTEEIVKNEENGIEEIQEISNVDISKKEEAIVEEIIKSEEPLEVIDEEKQEIDEKEFIPAYIPISEEEKEKLIKAIRPIIKDLNASEAYQRFCQGFMDAKQLKTYASISEDGKALMIKLTQNKTFNGMISSFIGASVIPMINDLISNEFNGKYIVTMEDNAIVIKRIFY